MLTRNRIFIDRTKGIGVLTPEDAVNYSITGPLARASGVVRDLRKDEPYLAYADLDFKVCCSRGGDCYARYLLRMNEMLESLKIIQQGIEQGQINKIDASTAVLIILHAIGGIESWHRSTHKISGEELEENMVTILIDGLKK